MRLKLFLSTTFLFLVLGLQGQSLIKARLVDKVTLDAIPFANIQFSSNIGTVSDINGYFSLSLRTGDSDTLHISHVSYESISLSLDSLKNISVIYLNPLSTDLGLVEISAAENPAHPIIRRAISARKANDPTGLPSYQYNSYNKLLFTIYGEDEYIDSLKLVIDKDDIRDLDESVKDRMEIDSLQDEQHLFISESVTEKKFLKPDRHYEKVLTTKTSGFKTPFLTTLATSFQPFTFYDETIVIMNSDYVNPVSPGTFNRYYFELLETQPSGTDSLYVIRFSPLKNRGNLLSGLLYIESGNHAIERVLATGSSPILETDFNIRQMYDKVNGASFPVQLYTDFLINDSDEFLSGKQLKVISDSYISNVQIAPDIKRSELKKVAIEFATTNEREQDAIFTRFRQEALTGRETRTYDVLDSIMSLPAFSWINLATEAIATMSYPIGWVDVDLNRILRYNEFEGLRLGLGLRTNEKVSKSISLGAYGAYGLRDKNLKYGADLTYSFNQPESFIQLAYAKDVFEQGQERTPYKRKISRTYVSDRFNRTEGIRATVSNMISRRIVVKAHLSQQSITTGYPYLYEQPQDASLQSQFDFTEMGVRVTYQPAKFIRLKNKFIKSSFGYPLVSFSYAKGFQGFLNGNYDYERFDLNIDNEFKYRAGGRFRFRINAGFIEGNTPYPLLFTGHGTSESDFFTFGYFQTMSLYEFTSDQYVNLFIAHSFGSSFWKTSFSSPVIELLQSAGIGSLNSANRHQQIDVKTASQPYLESGMKLNRLLHFKFNDAKYNINLGVFYRYGVHAFESFGENIFFTLDINQ